MTVAVPFCRVSLVIEKEIRVEVWLPQEWNQRFEGVGNAGLTGALNYPAMVAALKGHFATASTDTGHVTDHDVFQSDWIEGHAQRVTDFGHRAHHLMALRAKDVVRAYYGRGSSHNYFSGCSSGGWQGLTEAQRYPMDYDGILAGAPAIAGRMGGARHATGGDHCDPTQTGWHRGPFTASVPLSESGLVQG
jgi:tannase/feruloyl esterase